MAFFNKKEDVIEIELTPYGRSLLAIGKLNPSYYAFFDDDVLYDSESAGFTEDQAATKTRILQETMYLKPPRDLQSVEGLISTNERTEENIRPHTELNLNYLTEPLGTSLATNDVAPGWNSVLIQGDLNAELSSSSGITYFSDVTSVLSGSNQYLKQIPQINATIEYTLRINNVANDPPVRGQLSTPRAPVSSVYPDGTYLQVLEEQILCNLMEKKGFYLNDGLEVEVYIFDDDNSEKLNPLKFLPKQKLIENNILVDNPTPVIREIDPSYVEYYINFKTDEAISNEDICKGIQNLKSQDLETGLDIECPDLDNVYFDIYATDAEIEDCD
jgi:hypothetical protein